MLARLGPFIVLSPRALLPARNQDDARRECLGFGERSIEFSVFLREVTRGRQPRCAALVPHWIIGAALRWANRTDVVELRPRSNTAPFRADYSPGASMRDKGKFVFRGGVA